MYMRTRREKRLKKGFFKATIFSKCRASKQKEKIESLQFNPVK